MPTDEQIATAFNAGYTIQQVDPVLVEKLLSTDNNNSEIVQALTQGAKQMQRDKIAKQQKDIKERNNLNIKKR